jgi:muramoyltetrapeptide carboxypeptidase LdcA involved in peptidoglycan recycling
VDRPKLHLIAPAGSCRRFSEEIDVSGPAELIAMVQDAVGSDYVVTGDEAVIGADEDESRGGRQDDGHRAADIERALADSGVVAMVSLRGGSWFTRILPLIDFSVMDRRTKPIAVLGFSELTTLINIVAAHPKGLGIYDLSPAFLPYGLRKQSRDRKGAARSCSADADPGVSTSTTTRGHDTGRSYDSKLRAEFRAFFRDVVSMIEGRGSSRQVTARIVRGRLGERHSASFVGGNLSVLTTLLASPYRDSIAPRGGWLVLEDFNEPPYRLDRLLAQLTLAGVWKECAGLLLGDFHVGETDLVEAVESLLAFHLPPDRPIPVLVTKEVGHTWPMSPLQLHCELTLVRTESDGYSIHVPPSSLYVA